MPYFSIDTNEPIEETVQQPLLKIASVFVAKLLGKPESVVMVQIRHDQTLLFGGSNERAAFVQLRSIGLPQERCPEFTAKISHFVEDEFKIPQGRVFIEFQDLQGKMFGWNGKTF